MSRYRPHFSPLFIGEITSTLVHLRLQRQLENFSPLFIGEITSTPRMRSDPGGKRSISVPSSSGKSLQRNRRRAGTVWKRYFSPLFIGEITSTLPSKEVHKRHCVHFSPLFIGEITSTNSGGGAVLGSVRISVPSSSGKSLQPADVNALACPLIISVPSSSGKSLQRCVQPSDPLGVRSFQSPLHRGNHFNDSRTEDELCAMVISVPSSSGKSLQLSRKSKLSDKVVHFSPLFIGEITSTWR